MQANCHLDDLRGSPRWFGFVTKRTSTGSILLLYLGNLEHIQISFTIELLLEYSTYPSNHPQSEVAMKRNARWKKNVGLHQRTPWCFIREKKYSIWFRFKACAAYDWIQGNDHCYIGEIYHIRARTSRMEMGTIRKRCNCKSLYR